MFAYSCLVLDVDYGSFAVLSPVIFGLVWCLVVLVCLGLGGFVVFCVMLFICFFGVWVGGLTFVICDWWFLGLGLVVCFRFLDCVCV